MNGLGAILLVFASAALLGLHLWWRARLQRIEGALCRELKELKEREAEASARFTAQRDALLDSMAEGLLLLDESGRIELANRAFGELFAVTTDIRSLTVIEAIRSHQLAEIVHRLSAEKQVLEQELRLPPPDNRWLQVNGAAVLNRDGSRHGTILVFHDLTRIKRLENTRQEFVANVSHELRTPLSLIKGYVETLLDGARDDPEVTLKFLRIIQRNADRLQLLIEDLLAISELESGRVTLNLQSLDLNSIVNKVLEDFRTQAAKRKVTLLNNVQKVQVTADQVRLEQVIANLVDNAIKYGRDNGTVTISADITPAEVQVLVADDGPGIPTDALERVFERFYRLDKARSREAGGTGLGLSITKHIIQSHGGKIWAKSELGLGATFTFTLPASPAQLQPALF